MLVTAPGSKAQLAAAAPPAGQAGGFDWHLAEIARLEREVKSLEFAVPQIRFTECSLPTVLAAPGLRFMTNLPDLQDSNVLSANPSAAAWPC